MTAESAETVSVTVVAVGDGRCLECGNWSSGDYCTGYLIDNSPVLSVGLSSWHLCLYFSWNVRDYLPWNSVSNSVGLDVVDGPWDIVGDCPCNAIGDSSWDFVDDSSWDVPGDLSITGGNDSSWDRLGDLSWDFPGDLSWSVHDDCSINTIVGDP